ncbi:2-Hydroxy-4-oxobutane-1 [Trichoderma harzianum]|uniref:2-Hydroxy-4-oxobutane-1 n=1 Tax=Trichoderma harzianum TaxID=5544 RepID=A0A0F9ZUK9_TRIHA|nr:2-Hydroxy-4-oxobutane-1 [Trichoderma harzianum]
MVGALIDSHLDDGRYYDDAVALDTFAKAQELDVPIYIHPTTPLEDVQAALSDGNYDEEVGTALGIGGWDEKVGQIWLKAEMSFKEVWERNIWVATSGMFTMPPMACLLRSTSIDRIMYSVDYPYSTTEQGKAFMEELRESGLVTEEEYSKIAFKNAERLLNFKM